MRELFHSLFLFFSGLIFIYVTLMEWERFYREICNGPYKLLFVARVIGKVYFRLFIFSIGLIMTVCGVVFSAAWLEIGK